MKKCLLCVFVVLGLGVAQAQTYIGVGGTWLASSAYSSVPLLSVQVGGQTAPEFGRVEVRAAFDTILIFSNLGVDALASAHFEDASLRVYFGGGPDVLIFVTSDSVPDQERLPVSFGIHGTAGLEFFTGNVRPFAELQPAATLLYDGPVFGLRARAGLNFYF